MELGLMVGTGRRLDDAPLFDVTGRQGLMFGVGTSLYLSRRIAIGLDFEHYDLGTEDSGLLEGGEVAIDRDLNDLWLSMRLYPLRGDSVGMFVRFGLAAAWQSAELQATLIDPFNPSDTNHVRCEGADSLGFAIRGDLGVDAVLGDGVRIHAGVGFDSYRLSDDVLTACVPGAGTAAVFAVRTGIAYGWPL
jgi:hypothetical protein